MAEPLLELLAPYLNQEDSSSSIPTTDPITSKYLNRLSTLQLSALDTTEPQALNQSAHSTLLSLQALSTRSSKAIISSADELKSLQQSLPTLAKDAQELQNGISTLDKGAVKFSEKYSRSSENEVLDKRRKALMMSRNVDRVSDILDLPTLLFSAITSSTAQGTSSGANYASALDLHSHIKRLHTLYPDSPLVQSIYNQAEDAMREMTTNLIASLQVQNVKLAAGMRTIGWLRRIAPELDGRIKQNGSPTEGSLGALFLVCRLHNLLNMLEALDPLKELADRESTQLRMTNSDKTGDWSRGQQTERYLKRYIEIFREQSFAIVSMFNSIFPQGEAAGADDLGFQFKSLGLKTMAPDRPAVDEKDPLQPLPSALTTFPLHLVELLTETLKKYLPNVKDKSSRESLLTQVLYCASSLGRLGGDFGMMLVMINEEEEDELETPEWVTMMKKHRELAGRLESLASGKSGKSMEVESRQKVVKAS